MQASVAGVSCRVGAVVVAALLLQACSRADDAAVAPRLEVDADHWPTHVLELAQTTIAMVQERGEPAYLTEIDIQLPDVNPPPVTSVTYQFYQPRLRKTLGVNYASFDGVSLLPPPDQMEAARKAGVAEVFEAAAAAAVAPKFLDLGSPNSGYVPTPLLGVQVGLRDAYELARRGGLTKTTGIKLKVSTKDPKLPLVIWTFEGQHTQADAKAIHVNALTGALVDEDSINATTRAERDAQYAADMAMIRAYFAHRNGRSAVSPPGLTPEASSVVNGGDAPQQQHGMYFDGLHDYTVEPAADCAARGGTDGGSASFGGNFCY
ncbi:MAG: hypothetical protein R3E50_07075 [Halioglobus sp.]